MDIFQKTTKIDFANNNIAWHSHSIGCSDREKLHGHKGAVIWFTGLSGSGKSSIAGALEQELYRIGVSTYLIDGDNIRHGISCDLGFSDADRIKNIRRISQMVKIMQDAGLLVLTALISPYRHERQLVRHIIPEGRFIEVFVDTPLAVCEQRDPKGIYKKARLGEIKYFTGISSIYEMPEEPEIHLNGQELLIDLVAKILELLRHKDIIKS
ncbi:adenylyl-sulfate kinase [Candidatus Profftia tarda]